MKTATLLLASASVCMAAIGNFRVLGTTATQALIAYTAPDGNACIIQLSQSAGLTPPALDVDPGTFTNSNSDLGRQSTVTAGLSRTVVLGQRTAQLATAGTHAGVRHFSRALQAFTPVPLPETPQPSRSPRAIFHSGRRTATRGFPILCIPATSPGPNRLAVSLRSRLSIL
jgi:hypothetical protein